MDVWCFSACDIEWDCKRAFSVHFINSIRPPKMVETTVKTKINLKRKANRRFVLILSRSLMTNMTILVASVASLTSNLTEKNG